MVGDAPDLVGGYGPLPTDHRVQPLTPLVAGVAGLLHPDRRGQAESARRVRSPLTLPITTCQLVADHIPAWLGFNAIAHNLARWVTRLGRGVTLLTNKTVRTCFIALPGRLARSASAPARELAVAGRLPGRAGEPSLTRGAGGHAGVTAAAPRHAGSLLLVTLRPALTASFDSISDAGASPKSPPLSASTKPAYARLSGSA